MRNQMETHDDYGLSPLVEPLKVYLEYMKFVERLLLESLAVPSCIFANKHKQQRTDLVVIPQLRRTDLVVIPLCVISKRSVKNEGLEKTG